MYNTFSLHFSIFIPSLGTGILSFPPLCSMPIHATIHLKQFLKTSHGEFYIVPKILSASHQHCLAPTSHNKIYIHLDHKLSQFRGHPRNLGFFQLNHLRGFCSGDNSQIVLLCWSQDNSGLFRFVDFLAGGFKPP